MSGPVRKHVRTVRSWLRQVQKKRAEVGATPLEPEAKPAVKSHQADIDQVEALLNKYSPAYGADCDDQEE